MFVFCVFRVCKKYSMVLFVIILVNFINFLKIVVKVVREVKRKGNVGIFYIDIYFKSNCVEYYLYIIM